MRYVVFEMTNETPQRKPLEQYLDIHAFRNGVAQLVQVLKYTGRFEYVLLLKVKES